MIEDCFLDFKESVVDHCMPQFSSYLLFGTKNILLIATNLFTMVSIEAAFEVG